MDDLQPVARHAGSQVPAPSSITVATVREAGQRITANIERVIEGKQSAVSVGLAVLLAEGHLLIEDVPGVGKTKFAKALARSIDFSVRRDARYLNWKYIEAPHVRYCVAACWRR